VAYERVAMCWSPTLHSFPKPVSLPSGSASSQADVPTESFRIAFDDLIDSMEDEAADHSVEQEIAARDSRRASQTHQAVAGASPQQTAGYAPVAIPLGPGIPHCGPSSTWQQKVLDVEAKLQGDLQQDLARSVLETISDEEANPSSA
jgi:hypothetical protein